MPEMPPLQEGLYAVFEDAPQLLANRCDACNRVFFPRRQYCGSCSSPTLRSIALSKQGLLYAWSLIDRKPKLALIDPPYVQAEVSMPEGVHVFTLLHPCDVSQLSVGTLLEMYLADVPSPEGGGRLQAYMFRPVASSGIAV